MGVGSGAGGGGGAGGVESASAWEERVGVAGGGGACTTGSGGGGDFHGEPRSNQTHASSTDPEARLYKKSSGQEAKLSYLGHTLVENRNGLIAAAMTRPTAVPSAMRLY